MLHFPAPSNTDSLPSSVCGLLVEDEALADHGQQLASRLNIRRIQKPPAIGLALILSRKHLSLRMYHPKKSLNWSVVVDFAAKSWRKRLNQLHREHLVRAVGKKIEAGSLVIDATAGLGRDGFLLAAAGFEMILVERHPVVFALLEDGLRRAKTSGELSAVCRRMALVREDARIFLARNQRRPAVVYLDPMFPATTSSAFVKKEAQGLQLLTAGERPDRTLLDHARKAATAKVVVKRPASAAWLDNCQPSGSLPGKTIRFDIYPPLTGENLNP